jgi:radical SAM superfamily enzyme YgiQ (UPF0313 family)
MRTLLISLNSKYVHSSLAVWYLKQSAAEFSDVTILEGTVNQPAEDIVSNIVRRKPDVLAFSCYIWNISFIRFLLPLIREALPSVRIVLGGPEVSCNPKEILTENPDVDFVITGEGEVPFPLLLNALHQNADVSDVPGLFFRDRGGIRCGPPAPPLSEPPSPYSKEYMDALGGRIAYLETSRGCPFSCAFCLSGLSGREVRFFDMDRAKANILLLANSGCQTVKLVDRTFNCNPKRAFELFDFIIQNAHSAIPAGVRFHFEVAADLFDEQTLRLLFAAPPGLIQLEAGLQSFNPDTLKAVVRKTDINKAEENIRKIIYAGNIHLHADLIAGLPKEDLASFASSFDRAFALRPHMLQLGFLKMLHGSDLRRRAQEMEYRYSQKPPYEVKSNPWLSEGDMRLLRCAEYALNKLYNSGRFSLTLAYLLEASGIRPFGLFLGVGKTLLHIPLPERRSLDAFTRQAYGYFLTLPGVGQKKLRDALVCDRIACGQKIPDFLKVSDPDFKKSFNQIRRTFFEENGGEKINAAFLYAGAKRAVFAYGKKNPVTGRFPLRFT